MTKTAHMNEHVTNDPDGFSSVVRALFINLSNEALQSPSRHLSGSTTTSTFLTIYSQVQCWSDITSVKDCKTCLENVIGDLLDATTNGTCQGGMTGSGSCFARYEIYPFINPSSTPIQQTPSLQMKLVWLWVLLAVYL